MFTLNNIRKTENLDGYYVDSLPCPTCGDVLTLNLFPFEIYNYHQGAYVQDVLSAYNADVRERFISGTCDNCWNAMFALIEED